jgi:DNA-directed RNA polymerase subunit alpha
MHGNWRKLIRPRKIEFSENETTATYGKFVAVPLERGFGITIGNSLRRILLSSLQGAAFTGVKFDGVLHEFSTIPGVSEDVTDIILNLKQVKMCLHEGEETTISINANKEGVVTAGDLIVSDKISILNPEQPIATLNAEANLKGELTVRIGKGYVPAENNKSEEDPVGTVAVDSIFSPISRCNYHVTNARVGQRTDYDKLTMEVWTDGSVKPEDALAYAAKILKEQLQLFINFDELPEPVEQVVVAQDQPPVNENLYRRVEELELSVRSANCLQNANIRFIGELCQKSEAEMLKTKNFGRKSLNEIKEILVEMGLNLGMPLDGFDLADAEKYRPKDVE